MQGDRSWSPEFQIAAPTKCPIPAVAAIASAPQKVTRADARQTEAPPAIAPTAPSKARKRSDAPASIGTSSRIGATKTIRSEEQTSELQSLMRISYAVFCLKKKNNPHKTTYAITTDYYNDSTVYRSNTIQSK